MAPFDQKQTLEDHSPSALNSRKMEILAKLRTAFRVSVAVAVLTATTAAMACHERDTPERRAEVRQRFDAFKEQARKSTIVYGVLESGLGFNRNDAVPDPNKVATLRVLHVYQGDFQVGQRIQVRPGVWPLVTCPVPPLSLPRGAYGILILEKPSDDGPIFHNGFLPDDFVKTFLDEGIIQSATRRFPARD